MAIICTICCCLPLGIYGIIKAAKVNGLYMAGLYDEAVNAANEAKKWSYSRIGDSVNMVWSLWICSFCISLRTNTFISH